MEQWIEGAGAELVSVSSKFLDKPETEDRTLGSMVQNMQPDQAAIKIPICWNLTADVSEFWHFVIEIRYNSVSTSRQDTFRYSAIDDRCSGGPGVCDVSLKPPFPATLSIHPLPAILGARSQSNVRNR